MTELTTTLIRESKNDSYPHVSKSLKEWNLFMEKYGVLSESQILSELLFVLQGGQSVHFQLNEDNKQYLIEPSCHISKGFIFIVKDAFQVAEDCRYISEYVLNIQQKQTASTGQIHDSFVSWLHDLLKDYYKEIASFETKVFKSVEKQYEVAIIQPQGLGLRRLKGLLSCPKARLNLAKTLILDFQGKSGCDILRICTEYIHTGDMLLSPLIRSLVDKVHLF